MATYDTIESILRLLDPKTINGVFSGNEAEFVFIPYENSVNPNFRAGEEYNRQSIENLIVSLYWNIVDKKTQSIVLAKDTYRDSQMQMAKFHKLY